MYQLSTTDMRLVTQSIMDIRIKIDVYDDRTNEHLDTVECGIINGSSTVDAESDVRRTFSLTAVPANNTRLMLDKDGIIWLNRYFTIQVGIYDLAQQNWNWYKQGKYVITSTSDNYDATTNQITIDCSDFTAKLDGTKNGQIGGAATITFPAYEEDEDTGEVISYNYIRDAVITVLTQMGGITEYEIDDIGAYKAMPEYNPDYERYREEHPLWNTIPSDQEFSAGDNVMSIITTFRDLYSNYESYFDENGVFILKMIPSCYEDDIVFDEDFFNSIYISENTSTDLSAVRNICEVWGETIDVDYYTETCTYSNNCYAATVEEYAENYHDSDIISVKIPTQNEDGCTININKLGELPIIDEDTDEGIAASAMDEEKVYVFKIRKTIVGTDKSFKAYFLGQWQPHGLNVLTDGTVSDENYQTSKTSEDGTVIYEDYKDSDGNPVKIYSREYFQAVYNCESVGFTTIPDSPFTVQELGEIIDVKSGSEYDNITSDSLALSRAEYENWKNCRLTDSITISTKLCPFADVNIKVSYRRSDNGEANQYIVKSISHDYSEGTTNWTLMRFYPLYNN